MNSTDDGWRIDVPLPGIDPKDVTLEVAGNTLSIRAAATSDDKDRNVARYEQTLTIPQFLDLEKLSASHRHGMLRLTLPLKESVKPRRVQIETQPEDQKQLTGAVIAVTRWRARAVKEAARGQSRFRHCRNRTRCFAMHCYHHRQGGPIMLSTRIFGLACAVAVFVCLEAAPAYAQPLDKRTFFTFSGPVTLPGITLPAGRTSSDWPIQTAAPRSCKC